jgi:hypothetical protein
MLHNLHRLPWFLLLAPGLLRAEQPAPKLPLGKDTTVVTGPLDKDGYVDYEAALNERLGAGSKPERNANVLLWKAFGPRPEGGQGMPPLFFKLLGMDEPAERGDYFVGIETYLRERLKLTQAEIDAVYEQQGRAMEQPWAAQDSPHLAAWLKVNEKPLALAMEASRRPGYFNPLTSRRPEKGPSSLIAVLVPGVQKCRELAAALAARAMLRTQEGKFDEAWHDLLACGRLGRLVGRGATLIEALVGIAIDGIVNQARIAYLEHAGLTAAQARDRLRDLQGLAPLPAMADRIDLGERFLYLDCVQLIRRGGAEALDGLVGSSVGPAGTPRPKPDAQVKQWLERADWEPALRNGNLMFDRLAEALRTTSRPEREQRLEKIELEIKALKQNLTSPATKLRLFVGQALQPRGQPDKEMSKHLGDLMIALLTPAFRKLQHASDRAEQMQRNVHIAFALAAFRADRGSYPPRLDELAPAYLTAVPDDLFSGKALLYRGGANGYQLHSVGVNGQDDGGRWVDDNPPGDDPGVRMPRKKK